MTDQLYFSVDDHNYRYLELNPEPLKAHFDRDKLLNINLVFSKTNAMDSVASLTIVISKAKDSDDLVLHIYGNCYDPHFRHVNLFSGKIDAFQNLIVAGSGDSIEQGHLERDLHEQATLSGAAVCVNREAARYLESLVHASFSDYSSVPLSLSNPIDHNATPISVAVEDEDEDEDNEDQDEEPF